MATIWTLIDVCLGDARKAEELVRSASARRELRLHPETVLGRFALPRRTARVATRPTTVIDARRPQYATVDLVIER